MNNMELNELEKAAMALNDPKLREEALKAIAELRSLNANPAPLEVNPVNKTTPIFARKRPSLFESLRLYKDLKSSDPTIKKKAVMECWAKDNKEAALVTRTRDKLVDAAYSKKIRNEFQSRKFRFSLFTILNLFILVVFMVFATKMGLSKEIIIIIVTTEFFAFFFYVGNRLWRCPACGLKFDLNPRLGHSVSKSCPRCGAQLS